jgi:hypothetical protein
MVRMGDPLEEYLAIYDEAAGRVFVQLDAAIRQAAPELDVAIKYRLLSYTVDQDWRHWDGPLQGPAASSRVVGGRGSFYRSASSAPARRR